MVSFAYELALQPNILQLEGITCLLLKNLYSALGLGGHCACVLADFRKYACSMFFKDYPVCILSIGPALWQCQKAAT